MTAGLIRIPFDRIADYVGRPIDCPQTLQMDQDRIDRFAAVTEDYQWIHVDAARAAAESPFGTTIAHGFLTLSLLTWFLERTLAVDGGSMGVNYGLDRVRFVRPAPVGAALRGRFVLAAADAHDWGVQLAWDATITDAADAEAGWRKPIVAARWLSRRYR